jgi:pimeloyl-ACP methyl ester carboxylesterase
MYEVDIEFDAVTTPTEAVPPAVPLEPDVLRLSAVGRGSRLFAWLRRAADPMRRDQAGVLFAAVAVSGAAWGAVVGWWTPRGPLTSGEALGTLVGSTVIGIVAGFVGPRRWTRLLLAASFAAVVELVRLGVEGPTVDRPQFTTYGILAFAVGRGFHALVSLAPLTWGATMGASFGRAVVGSARPARRLARYSRRGLALTTGLGLLLLGAGLARPPQTAAVPEGGVAELTRIDVNGRSLGIMIRGRDATAPVLLFLAGGPGGSEIGAMRRHLQGLEEHFVVATWDQRGTGTSYRSLDPTSDYTLQSAIDDTVSVTNYLRDRFQTSKISILGQSWGSILGVLAVQVHPEFYDAFIGAGQMVSPLATDTIFYNDTLAWAERTGNGGLAKRLRKIGPPPYHSMLDYETALSFEHDVYPYDHAANSEGAGGFSENFLVREYSLLDQVHLLGAFMDTFSVLYPQLQDIDFRAQVSRLEVPVFVAQGAHEADGRARPFEEWFAALEAPSKSMQTFETSGHRPLFEQPDEFIAYMVDNVLASRTK